MTWSHTFINHNPETDTVFFAWTYPYSFDESLKRTQRLMLKFKDSPTVYVHREVLALSREKRPMEMVTLTSKFKMLEERE